MIEYDNSNGTMPTCYRPPLGLPLRWQDEHSGQLVAAIDAYFRTVADESQLALVRAYCQYYIEAPCWDDPVQGDEEGQQQLATLRTEEKELHSALDIAEWVYRCLEVGIDPL